MNVEVQLSSVTGIHQSATTLKSLTDKENEVDHGYSTALYRKTLGPAIHTDILSPIKPTQGLLLMANESPMASVDFSYPM